MRCSLIVLTIASMLGSVWGQIAPGFDPAALREACANKDAVACHELGMILVRGQLGVTADPEAGQRLLARACRLGRRTACADTAVKVDFDDQRSPKGLKAMYEKNCATGDLVACSRLGNLLVDFNGVPSDYERARRLHTRACDGGALIGCYNLGFMFETGKGGSTDLAKAAQLYQRTCSGGHMSGCNGLGVLYKEGRHFKQDFRAARRYFEPACAKGEPRACNNLAELIYRGLAGLAKDWDRVVGLYEKTCAQRSLWGCERLAAIRQGAPGAPDRLINTQKAFDAMEKACQFGSGTGCFNAGIRHQLGRGVPVDVARAVSYYSKACDLGEMSGCFNHGNELYKGEAVPADPLGAFTRWRRACELGHAKACQVLKSAPMKMP